MELRKRAFGISFGLIWGLVGMLATWFLLMKGSPGGTISTIGAFYFGYSYSFVGGILGFIWGFIYGFICGFLFAWFYNMISKTVKPNKA
ncbi:MAG TPA: hypothetical protein VHT73_01495 [Thermodesulfobacteriota bacterium]|nr:hypothetical protein [Thermodesulfobacteriota bacterium]